jgi:hypothetical protein
MAGCLYQFCTGCEHRTDKGKEIACPAGFNPYDNEKCPRHEKYISLHVRYNIAKGR